MFRLQDERQTERLIGVCREWLLWAKEHGVDIYVHTEWKEKYVVIELVSHLESGSKEIYAARFTEEDFKSYTTEEIFNILERGYEGLTIERRI